MFNLDIFLSIFEAKNYVIFDSSDYDYNLNIVGWRNQDARINSFDDFLSVYWRYDDVWYEKSWSITTRPGVPWLEAPLNPKGTAILVPGQYLDAYRLGIYKGYQALKQYREVEVYRDSDLDSAWNENPDTIDTGLFGIHIHKAGFFNSIVGASSAGCQVFQRETDFSEFIEICQSSKLRFGNKFSYTLVEY